jgi:proline racemase
MKLAMKRRIFAVDSHTEGEPTRVVIGGIPAIPGKDMVEKRRYLEEHLDHIRTSIMLEPRGHNDMFGSILTAPTRPEAHLGIIFMDGGGYLNMCGHGTIGAVTVALEMGLIEAAGSEMEVVLEAPAGLVRCRATLEGERVTGVSFTNVPAFLYRQDAVVFLPRKVMEENLPGIALKGDADTVPVTLDIAFGGNFFAIVPAADYGISLAPDNASRLIRLGMEVMEAVNEQVPVQHPELPHINRVDLTEFSRNEGPNFYKNAVVFGLGQLDRSPCGTGTCAKMASLHRRGKLAVGDTFIHDSILNTRFYGKILGTTTVGELPAVIPEITGAAFITGINQFILDDADPLTRGFSLK